MPQKQKIAAEEKVKIVREYLGQKVRISEAAQADGVDRQTIRSWIGIYENHGIEGFTQKRNRHHTVDTKTAAVIEYLNGRSSLQTVCKKPHTKHNATP